MFNTIKSKILLIVFTMLVTLSIVLSVFSYIYLKNSKSLIIQSCSYSIGQIVQNINKEITKIENNSKDLALIGEIYYTSAKNKSSIEHNVKRVFENYPMFLGGGIWYKPNSIDPLKKFYCVYAFRDKKSNIYIDERYETPEYNYPEQSWYKEIVSHLEGDDDNVAWSLPYFENEGGHTFMVTAGSGMYVDGKLVGISTVDWELGSIAKSIRDIKPTKNSFALFADIENDYIIASTDPFLNNVELTGKSLKNIPWFTTKEYLKKITYITYHNQKYIPYVKTLDNGMVVIVCVPKSEIFYLIVVQVITLFAILILISLIISACLYISLNNNINRPIKILVDVANKISQGNLNLTIRLTKPEEFARLATTLDKMCKDIKSITKQREKIEAELNLAKEIQASSLPNIFPPYPERYDFDIFASMDPALNVGGDFYDFYMLNENKVLFLVADVSGKGVPAALFMMIVKTIVSGIMQYVDDLPYAIKSINERICANNKRNFFVTMLIGVMDLKNNKLSLINCGHNPPLIRHKEGDFEYIQLESNIVLGAIKDFNFVIKEIDFNAGDEIFLYTDGVTEAMDKDDNLYSEKRLLETLNKNKTISLKHKCENVKKDIEQYSQDVAQSDDITMLVFKYYGKYDTYKNVASKENYNIFLSWLSDRLDLLNVSSAVRQNIELSFEEIYTNIFSYAYPPFEGEVEISIKREGDDIVLRFKDWGVPYNPLEKQDPDINLPPEQRPVGGLGIFMVKQLSKSVEYIYENANILTVRF